jgi:ATP-dependent helicase/DNAse subunit B
VRDHGRVPLRLITGPANSTKAGAVLDGYREALPSSPLLVVPTWADVEHYRAELAAGGLVLGVRVERFAGLIAEIARRVGAAGEPLSAVARAQLVAHAVASVRLQAIGASAGTPGFADALSDLISELRQHRVGPARLTSALRAWAGSDVERRGYADDLGALYRAYDRLLDGVGRPDAELYASRALDALRLEPRRWRDTPVLFYGFDDFTPLELDAIETLSRAGAPVTVSLPFEPGRVALEGRAATFQALAPLADDHRRLPPSPRFYAPHAAQALHHLERSLFEPGARRVAAGAAVALLEGGGERAELELVAAAVADALEQGIAPADVAVVVRSPGADAELIQAVLASRGIACAAAHRRPFADTALGAGLLALDRCASGRGRSQDLLRWLRTPGMLRRPELADRLERQLRRGGIAEAAEARAVWERDGWPLEDVDRLARARGAGSRAHLEELGRALDRLFAAPHRRQAAVLADEELAEARAWSAARAALTDLAGLAAAQPGLAGDGDRLAATLAAVEVAVGERPGPDHVLVADPLALRARRVRALFACGLLEGVFPRPRAPEPFLSPERRRELAMASGLVLDRVEDPLAAERYLFYATVSRAEERLGLSWRTGDDEGRPALRSLFVDDVCDCFEEDLLGQRSRRRLGAARDEPAGRGSASALSAPAVSAPAAGKAPAAVSGPVAGDAPAAANGADRGLGHPAVLADLRGRPAYSASALEAYLSCPVRWFVERYLAPDKLEPDHEALARGGLAHAVLERTLAELERRTGSARLRPEVLELAKRLAVQAIEEDAERSHALSPSPERRAVTLRRLRADLDRYLELGAACGTRFEPRHLELEFGMGAEKARRDAEPAEPGGARNAEPGAEAGRDAEHGAAEDAAGEDAEPGYPALELAPGLRLRGRIDRVDVDPDTAQAIVYDYKGREAPPGRAWEEKGRLQIALYMRAVHDLLGLEPVGGFYQPLTARDQRPRGALLAEADPELDCLANDRFTRAELDELMASAARLAIHAAERIRTGRLEARPQTCSPGGGCAYPGICRCEDAA